MSSGICTRPTSTKDCFKAIFVSVCMVLYQLYRRWRRKLAMIKYTLIDGSFRANFVVFRLFTITFSWKYYPVVCYNYYFSFIWLWGFIVVVHYYIAQVLRKGLVVFCWLLLESGWWTWIHVVYRVSVSISVNGMIL